MRNPGRVGERAPAALTTLPGSFPGPGGHTDGRARPAGAVARRGQNDHNLHWRHYLHWQCLAA